MLIDGEAEYEVNRIVRHCHCWGRGSGLEYLVSFVGYDESTSEWVTEYNLANALDKLA